MTIVSELELATTLQQECRNNKDNNEQRISMEVWKYNQPHHQGSDTVSYTHLDVYKRQLLCYVTR